MNAMVAQHHDNYRLSTSLDYIRRREKIQPTRFIIISVEGEKTEKDYFEALGKCFWEYGSSTKGKIIIGIEVLRHKESNGYSAPKQIIELMDEYSDLRNDKDVLSLDNFEMLKKDFKAEEIEQFLSNNPILSLEKKKNIQEKLNILDINLPYRKYLAQYRSDEDRFVIVMDRDKGSHTEKVLQECMTHCQERGYEFYLSNPCFEFWLLLHLSDVADEYPDKMDCFLENKKISNQHSYVSRLLSEKAHHRKSISYNKFKKQYLPHIKCAIENSHKLPHELGKLFSNVGTNMADFFQKGGLMELLDEIECNMKKEDIAKDEI